MRKYVYTIDKDAMNDGKKAYLKAKSEYEYIDRQIAELQSDGLYGLNKVSQAAVRDLEASKVTVSEEIIANYLRPAKEKAVKHLLRQSMVSEEYYKNCKEVLDLFDRELIGTPEELDRILYKYFDNPIVRRKTGVYADKNGWDGFFMADNEEDIKHLYDIYFDDICAGACRSPINGYHQLYFNYDSAAGEEDPVMKLIKDLGLVDAWE